MCLHLAQCGLDQIKFFFSSLPDSILVNKGSRNSCNEWPTSHRTWSAEVGH